MAKSTNVIIGIVLLIVLVIYGIFVYISYRDQKWIFEPYDPPPLKNGFRPGGKPVPLTSAEIARRKAQLTGT